MQRGRSSLVLGLFFTLLASTHGSLGQLSKAAPASAQAPQAQTPIDPLGRSTPRGTVLGFLSAAYNQKFETAAQYLDTRATGERAATLAQQLYFVLDRKLPAKLNSVSNDPLGSPSDLPDSRQELIGTVVTEKIGSIDICLERVERPNSPPLWLFSRQTLADIPDVYDEINATSVEHILPDFLLKRYFGITLFAWTFYLVFLPVLYIALSVANRLISGSVGYALRRWTHRELLHNPTILPHPLRILILSCTIFVTLRLINLPLVARQMGSTVAALLLIVAFVWAMFLISAKVEAHFKKEMEKSGRLSATAVLHAGRTVMDLISIIAGLIFLLHALGINPTATLAGLGVGGIAVALAAQKTLENVIGGASLIMDGALRVGDTFKIGNVTGTIEVIGLRSTRLRTPDRTVVTIPNGQMATMTLENLSARDQFWLRHLIGLECGTAPEALNSILGEVRNLLERDARVLPLTARVRLVRFAESSLELEVVAYVSAPDWNQFLEIQEDLLIKIRQLIDAAGVGLAYPSRTIYLKNEIDMALAALQPPLHGTIAEKDAGHEMHSR